MYIDEVAAATHAGLTYELIHFEAIADQHNAARAVRDVSVHNTPELAVYRGWMLTAAEYKWLYDALLSRGIQLINNPRQYTYTHHLPENYHAIKELTPKTVWLDTAGVALDYDLINDMLLTFGSAPLILKDFVKSEKGYWRQATHITSASDEQAVRNTIEFFLKLRGDDLQGGLVFREFMEFTRVSEQTKSGMPLIKEYRIFYLNGVPIDTVRYWNVADYDDDDLVIPMEQFDAVAQNIRSRFFTMDVAQRTDGKWMIIELGDGQVAGLPDSTDIDAFYQRLAGAH